MALSIPLLQAYMHDRRDAVVPGLGQRWWCIGLLAYRTECYSPGAYRTERYSPRVYTGQSVIVPGLQYRALYSQGLQDRAL